MGQPDQTFEQESIVRRELRTFFEEKQLIEREYIVQDEESGDTHFMDTAFIIDLILNHASENQKKDIQKILVRLDFCNTDVHHFLEYLAKAFVKVQSEAAAQSPDPEQTNEGI